MLCQDPRARRLGAVVLRGWNPTACPSSRDRGAFLTPRNGRAYTPALHTGSKRHGSFLVGQARDGHPQTSCWARGSEARPARRSGFRLEAPGPRWARAIVMRGVVVLGAAFASPGNADKATLESAFEDYAAGRLDDALKKLTEYVASNPGDDEVYAVLRNVDEAVKLRALAAGGD